MAKLKIKMGVVKKIDDQQALNILRTMGGSTRAALSEIRTEIYRQTNNGVKFLHIAVAAPDGTPLPPKEIAKLATLQNNDFKKSGFGWRVRYSESERALIVVPVKNYAEVFGGRAGK